jgi:hypothetical protein
LFWNGRLLVRRLCMPRFLGDLARLTAVRV